MSSKGIDHTTCPKARVVPALWSLAERGFAEVLMSAFKPKSVNVFVKVRVLDVIELYGEPDRKRLFFWRDVLGDKHFDYVVCRRGTLEPLIAIELDDASRRSRTSTEIDVKTTVAARARFPVVRFNASTTPTPLAIRERLIEAYRAARDGAVLEEMG
jgi:hypothetical protein